MFLLLVVCALSASAIAQLPVRLGGGPVWRREVREIVGRHCPELDAETWGRLDVVYLRHLAAIDARVLDSMLKLGTMALGSEPGESLDAYAARTYDRFVVMAEVQRHHDAFVEALVGALSAQAPEARTAIRTELEFSRALSVCSLLLPFHLEPASIGFQIDLLARMPIPAKPANRQAIVDAKTAFVAFMREATRTAEQEQIAAQRRSQARKRAEPARTDEVAHQQWADLESPRTEDDPEAIRRLARLRADIDEAILRAAEDLPSGWKRAVLTVGTGELSLHGVEPLTDLLQEVSQRVSRVGFPESKREETLAELRVWVERENQAVTEALRRRIRMAREIERNSAGVESAEAVRSGFKEMIVSARDEAFAPIAKMRAGAESDEDGGNEEAQIDEAVLARVLREPAMTILALAAAARAELPAEEEAEEAEEPSAADAEVRRIASFTGAWTPTLPSPRDVRMALRDAGGSDVDLVHGEELLVAADRRYRSQLAARIKEGPRDGDPTPELSLQRDLRSMGMAAVQSFVGTLELAFERKDGATFRAWRAVWLRCDLESAIDDRGLVEIAGSPVNRVLANASLGRAALGSVSAPDARRALLAVLVERAAADELAVQAFDDAAIDRAFRQRPFPAYDSDARLEEQDRRDAEWARTELAATEPLRIAAQVLATRERELAGLLRAALPAEAWNEVRLGHVTEVSPDIGSICQVLFQRSARLREANAGDVAEVLSGELETKARGLVEMASDRFFTELAEQAEPFASERFGRALDWTRFRVRQESLALLDRVAIKEGALRLGRGPLPESHPESHPELHPESLEELPPLRVYLIGFPAAVKRWKIR
jgi:hypothetical protein